jgi:PAS domain-containing protein
MPSSNRPSVDASPANGTSSPADGLPYDELARREQHYRALIENANDIVYVHDFEGNFKEVNAAAVRVFGYSLDEIKQMNVKDIVDPEWLAIARDPGRAV